MKNGRAAVKEGVGIDGNGCGKSSGLGSVWDSAALLPITVINNLLSRDSVAPCWPNVLLYATINSMDFN
jgi:hypothetical protein